MMKSDGPTFFKKSHMFESQKMQLGGGFKVCS